MRVYAHRHRPEAYPEFTKRPIRVTTRETLENTIQFMSLRALPHEPDGTLMSIEEALDLYTKDFSLGKVFWMRANTVTAPNLPAFLNEVKKRGGYVFDLWGYVPGSYKDGLDWGEYVVTDDIHAEFTKTLGDRFIGYDNGEQDGRYIGSYARTQCPAKQTDAFQHRRFYEFFDEMGSALRHATTALCSLNYCHFFARENNCYILGAETAQALPNATLWYAYLRGAGKQYGLLWFGNASVYNRFSWKSYEREDTSRDAEGYSYGPKVGTSLSLLRRLLYAEYLYNCDMLGYESGLITRKSALSAMERGEALPPLGAKLSEKKGLIPTDEAALSPIGRLQADCIRFVGEHGYAGVMHTPVAIVLGAQNGWTMPRSLYFPEVYRAWGQIPYGEGDHQLHALFSLMYTGYEDSGFFLNERGFMAATPMGEIADVLTGDVKSAVLNTYNLLILSGAQETDSEQLDKAEEFMRSGGTAVAFAAQIAKSPRALGLFGVAEIGEAVKRNAARVEYGGRAYDEGSFTVYPARFAGDAKPLCVSENGDALIAERAVGGGRAILVMSPYGMCDDMNAEPMHNEVNRSIPLVYDLLKSVKALIKDLTYAERLADVGNDALEVIVNVKDERTLTVTAINPGYEVEPVRVRLLKGTEIARREIDIPDLDHATPGYYPPCYTPPALCGAREEETIEPGQIRMWEIEFEPRDIRYEGEATLADETGNLFVSVRPNGTLLDALNKMPALPNYFSGIKLDACDVDDMSEEHAIKCSGWLKRRALRVIVDFASLMDHYPHLSLINNMPWKYERNMAWIGRLLDKSRLLGADRVILVTHRNAENHLTHDEALAQMRESILRISDMAKARGMEAWIENGVPRAVADTVESARSLLGELPLAANLGHAIMSGEAPSAETLACVRGALIHAPLTDGFGQMCDAHMPAMNRPTAEAAYSILRGLRPETLDFVCLDGIYENFGEMYDDRKALLKAIR